MLLNYKSQHAGNNGKRKRINDVNFASDEETGNQTNMSFPQAVTGIPDSDGVFHKQIKCFS